MAEEELRAALQEARDRADRLDFLLGAADLDIRGWFQRAEEHAERANSAEAALREATAEVERVKGLLREWLLSGDGDTVWAAWPSRDLLTQTHEALGESWCTDCGGCGGCGLCTRCEDSPPNSESPCKTCGGSGVVSQPAPGTGEEGKQG